MRLQIMLLSCLLPLLAAGADTLSYSDYQVTRTQAQAAGTKLAAAGRELDIYLASDAAKRFDPEESDNGEDLPSEVFAILARSGIDLENLGELTESTDTTSVSAIGYAVFKVCDGENAALLQLRKTWTARAVDIGFLSLSAADKAGVSPAVIRQVRAEILPVAQAYLDSWLAVAAVKVGCAPQAIRYADFALADSTSTLADGVLGMTRSGLLLSAAHSEGEIELALQARRTSLSAITREAKRLIPKLKEWDPEFESEFSESDIAETFKFIQQYDDEFNRLAGQNQSPIWRVKSTAAPKISTIGHWRCGTPEAMADQFLAVAAPYWPTATAVLQARKADQTLAAYTLARWFETENQISFINRERFWVEESASTNPIWQAYGQAETKAEFERAANAITLSAPENGLAIVKIFGHEFLLASGERNSPQLPSPTRWFTLAEIQANFRNSYPYKTLTGE